MSEFSENLKNEYNRARIAVLNANKTPLTNDTVRGFLFYIN